MRDVLEIQDELEAVAAERYERWQRGEPAGDLTAKLDELWEEKRAAMLGPVDRDAVIQASRAEGKREGQTDRKRPANKQRAGQTMDAVRGQAAERRRRAYEMFDAGRGTDEIAAEVGIGISSVYTMRSVWKKEREAAAA